MNKLLVLLAASVGVLAVACNLGNRTQNKEESVEIEVVKAEITFKSTDGLPVTGDLYIHENKKNPSFIVLFHQAGYSRGEYNQTAQVFIEWGYNVLSIDQRSGSTVNNVENLTHKRAVEQGLSTEYIDAMPDLLAAIDYVHENYSPKKLIILGSSYSATLSLIIAATFPEKIDAVLAFSPGEYFTYHKKMIKDFAREVEVPVFITSAKKEHKQWKDIYEAIPGNDKEMFVPQVEGIHGSRALWESTPGNEAYWKATQEFLSGI